MEAINGKVTEVDSEKQFWPLIRSPLWMREGEGGVNRFGSRY